MLIVKKRTYDERTVSDYVYGNVTDVKKNDGKKTTGN